jgi:hypothetical protein
MPENKNTLDQHFKNRLTDLEVKPDSAVWQNIRAKSPAVTEKKGGVIRPFIQRYGAVAASVVLGIGMVTWMLNPNQFAIKPPIAVTTEITNDDAPIHQPERTASAHTREVHPAPTQALTAITATTINPKSASVTVSPQTMPVKPQPKPQKTVELPPIGTKTVALASAEREDSFIGSLLPRITITIDSDAEPETVHPPAPVAEERPAARRYDSPAAFIQAKVRDQLGIKKQVDPEKQREVIEWNNPFFKVRHTRKIQQEKP